MVLLRRKGTAMSLLARPGYARFRCQHPKDAEWFPDLATAEAQAARLPDEWEPVHVYLFTTPINPEEIEP